MYPRRMIRQHEGSWVRGLRGLLKPGSGGKTKLFMWAGMAYQSPCSPRGSSDTAELAFNQGRHAYKAKQILGRMAGQQKSLKHAINPNNTSNRSIDPLLSPLVSKTLYKFS
jgi:hypothetical protein